MVLPKVARRGNVGEEDGEWRGWRRDVGILGCGGGFDGVGGETSSRMLELGRLVVSRMARWTLKGSSEKDASLGAARALVEGGSWGAAH